MSDSAVPGVSEVPTFSECVLGYRAWGIDGQGRLWPISDKCSPWEPGVNTARCNCRVTGALSFDWSWRDGRRVLEAHPRHAAPDPDCRCGLYSWRRPPRRWAHDQRLASGTRVCGAVASWGQIQVHGPGFRAEHACVVTLAYPVGTGVEEMQTLERVAARYGVDLVPLDQLQEAASRHGSPLPDSLGSEPIDGEPDGVTALSRDPEFDQEPASALSQLRSGPPRKPEPMSIRERIGIVLLLFSLGVGSCGGWMLHGRGSVGWIGLAMVGASGVGIAIASWWLNPRTMHQRFKDWRAHRRHARHQRPEPKMTEAEFDAIEDALEPLYRHGNGLDNKLDPYAGL